MPTSNSLQSIALNARVIFWDVSDPTTLSPDAITERILKYGTWDEVCETMATLGPDFSAIACRLVAKPRNYFTPKEKNFIRHLVEHHEKELLTLP